jgi:hypothetical protein
MSTAPLAIDAHVGATYKTDWPVRPSLLVIDAHVNATSRETTR